MHAAFKWHTIEAEKTLKELATNLKGLTDYEAARRLRESGPNVLQEGEKINPLSIFAAQFKSVLVIVLIIAAILSYMIGLYVNPEEGYIDSAVIMIIVALNAVFGFVQEYRAQKAVEALKKLTAQRAVVIRGAKKISVSSTDIVPGDIVVLEEGSIVPADVRIIESVNLRVDEAPLTGESQPVGKNIEAMSDVALAERKNMAYMGTLCTYGRGLGVVVSTGMQTEMGKIAHMLGDVEEEQTPLQKRLAVFGRRLGLLIFGITIVIIAVGIVRDIVLVPGQSIAEQINVVIDIIKTAIALAVAAVPEGLPAVVTITLALGLSRLSKKNAIVKRLPAVETLGSTSVICSDKTGTLTKNEMTVARIWSLDAEVQVSGEGYEAKGDFLSNGKKVQLNESINRTLLFGALCNNASAEAGKITGDPTEAALLVAFRKSGLSMKGYKRVYELPFSSQRKMMSVSCKTGSNYSVCVKGAPEIVASRCTHALKNGKIVKMGPDEKKSIIEANNRLAQDALRVLAVAYKESTVLEKGEKEAESGLVFCGLSGMIDPPRHEVKKDIEICSKAGIRVIMVTGDNKGTAVAVAKTLGLFKKGDIALEGADLDRMSENELLTSVHKVSVFARVNPEHKLKIVSLLQKKGTVVAMTGDGVNDAPALKKADIGIAMGIKGTDVSKEAADMILADDNFGSIVAAIEGGRAIFDNIRKFIQYLLSSNLGEVMIVFGAMIIGFSDPLATGLDAARIVLPLTAIQLLWINLLTDGLPALALGVDPPSKGIMERRPASRNILDREMFTDMLIVGTLMTAGVLGLFTYHLLILKSGTLMATTIAFTTVVAFEMVRVQSVRMKYGLSLFSNMKLVAAIAISLGLQIAVVYVPALQVAFGTVPLGLWEILQITGVSLSVMVVMRVKEKLISRNIKESA